MPKKLRLGGQAAGILRGWLRGCEQDKAAQENRCHPMNEVTRILSALEQGDSRAAEQLLPLVYDELR